MRILLGYDRAVFKGLRVGARLGFALGGGPETESGGSFMPIHAEARGAWWFIDKPSVIQPYAMLSLGMMQIDGKVVVTVVNPPESEIPDSVPNEQGHGDQERMLEAWTKKGLPFVSIGGGAQFAISPNMGPVVEVKAGQTFGSSGTFLAANLGFAYGF